MKRITTQSGTVYEYDDDGFLDRLRRTGGKPIRLLDDVPVYDDWKRVRTISYAEGEPLFATFSDGTWIQSTKVVSIEEVPDEV